MAGSSSIDIVPMGVEALAVLGTNDVVFLRITRWCFDEDSFQICEIQADLRAGSIDGVDPGTGVGGGCPRVDCLAYVRDNANALALVAE